MLEREGRNRKFRRVGRRVFAQQRMQQRPVEGVAPADPLEDGEGDLRHVVPPLPPQQQGELHGVPRGGEDAACDVCVTPLLAVDERGVRLGYGGGYYDAYFARRPQTVRVGYCFEVQRTRLLPKEAWDKPLHAVVTEAGVHRFNA